MLQLQAGLYGEAVDLGIDIRVSKQLSIDHLFVAANLDHRYHPTDISLKHLIATRTLCLRRSAKRAGSMALLIKQRRCGCE